MAGSAKINVLIDALLTGSVDIGTVQHDVKYGPGFSWGDGTGLDSINQIWSDTRTLSASSSEDLDLSGSLTNAIGTSVAFTKIRGIMVRAALANTNNVIVGGASATQFVAWCGGATHTVTVRPGGLLLLLAPDATAYAVSAGSTDLLKIANSSSGSSVSYDILLLGSQ